MINAVARIRDLIPVEERQSKGYLTNCTLNVQAHKGQRMQCFFCGVEISFELYQKVFDWMNTGLTWDEWLERNQIYKPIGTVVDSDVFPVNKGNKE